MKQKLHRNYGRHKIMHENEANFSWVFHFFCWKVKVKLNKNVPFSLGIAISRSVLKDDIFFLSWKILQLLLSLVFRSDAMSLTSPTTCPNTRTSSLSCAMRLADWRRRLCWRGTLGRSRATKSRLRSWKSSEMRWCQTSGSRWSSGMFWRK